VGKNKKNKTYRVQETFRVGGKGRKQRGPFGLPIQQLKVKSAILSVGPQKRKKPGKEGEGGKTLYSTRLGVALQKETNPAGGVKWKGELSDWD